VLSCRLARRALDARSDERLGLERGFELDAHLEGCARCRRHARSLQRLEDAFAGLPDPPWQRLDVEASVRSIRARLAAAPARPGARSARSRRVGLALFVAAAAAVLALFMLQRTRQQASTPDEPASPSPPLASAAPGPDELAPTVEEPVPDSLALDPARLQRTREEVAQLLLEAASGLEPEASREAVLAFAQLFDLNSLALRRADWPVQRLVERLLEAPDARASRAAARYLGVRGDGASRARLELALERPEVARAATLALRDSGAAGAAGLGRALGLDAQRELALRCLLEVGGSAAARALAQRSAIECAQAGKEAQTAELLAALASLGEPALEPLFALAAEGALGRGELVSLLGGIDGAAEWIVRGLATRERAASRELRLEAAAQLAPETTALWLEEHAHEREVEVLARRLLPRVPGPAAVRALMRLEGDTRLSSEDMQALLRAALGADAERFAGEARALLQTAEAEPQAVLAELLIAADSALALPAMRVLHRSPLLPDDLGRDLVLEIGELGDARDAEALLELFGELGADDRLFAASCLIAIQRLAGDEAIARALDDMSARSLSNVLGLLHRRTTGTRWTPSIYKLGRELKPYLSERSSNSWRSSS
jgi:hypothetical protein